MLTTKQIDALLAPLDPTRVRKDGKGMSHLEAWDVRRHLLRVFGWGGWDFTVQDCTLISERSTDAEKPRHTVVYRVIGRLTIKDPDGNILAVFEDGATGDSVNQPSLGDAHDMALKTAMSQTLKRCAVNLGDRYGMSLYSKTGGSAVVGGSLAHAHDKVTAPVSEAVTSGEMDAPPEAGGGDGGAPQTPAAPAIALPNPPAPAENPEGVVAPDGVDAGSSSPEADVEALRERVLTTMQLPKQEAIRAYARLQLDIAKAGVQGVMVTSPAGSQMTLGASVSQALDFVSKPRQGNSAADAAAGEAKAS